MEVKKEMEKTVILTLLKLRWTRFSFMLLFMISIFSGLVTGESSIETEPVPTKEAKLSEKKLEK